MSPSSKAVRSTQGWTSFDRRIVRYEEIHSINSDDFRAFVDAAAVKGPCHILDCGCGYGAFTREVLRATESSRSTGETDLSIDLIDESPVQLARAEDELRPWQSAPAVELHFIGGVFPDDLGQSSEQYDVVACKMVLHEIRKDQQLRFVENAFDCLKPGGRFVAWDVCLSPDIATFYRDVIKSKDAIAGYDSMAERRYFLTEEELRTLFRSSSFGGVEFVRDILYRFDTRKRLIPEFGGDEFLFAQWEDFIRKAAAALSPAVLARLQYLDSGNSISFNVRKVIVVGRRPDSTKLVHGEA